VRIGRPGIAATIAAQNPAAPCRQRRPWADASRGETLNAAIKAGGSSLAIIARPMADLGYSSIVPGLRPVRARKARRDVQGHDPSASCRERVDVFCSGVSDESCLSLLSSGEGGCASDEQTGGSVRGEKPYRSPISGRTPPLGGGGMKQATPQPSNPDASRRITRSSWTGLQHPPAGWTSSSGTFEAGVDEHRNPGLVAEAPQNGRRTAGFSSQRTICGAPCRRHAPRGDARAPFGLHGGDGQ